MLCIMRGRELMNPEYVEEALLKSNLFYACLLINQMYATKILSHGQKKKNSFFWRDHLGLRGKK